jgi:hypothetical protein
MYKQAYSHFFILYLSLELLSNSCANGNDVQIGRNERSAGHRIAK